MGPKLPLTAARSLPDPLQIHTELRGHGVTLELLHLEYLADRIRTASATRPSAGTTAFGSVNEIWPPSDAEMWPPSEVDRLQTWLGSTIWSDDHYFCRFTA